MQEFCQEYLGENYDYVFTVHTDSAHIHAHVIFNSVSRLTGLSSILYIPSHIYS
ncbi:relaxase/mobilization nuclease domain-containing protein [Blautia coccoides]|uniref:relaxase/mobilization nuclease domain-containing protein n=1 Tax=Blautia TaxID=572511 RepID=UPI0035112D88